jgi:putative ABC transport system permease protein
VSLVESMRVALTAIAANRLRSGLTVLGVVIGVMSVVLLVAVGTGARDEVTRGVEQLGSNLLIVAPGDVSFGSAPSRSRFTLADVDRLERDLRGEGVVTGSVTSGEVARGDGQSVRISLLGVTASFDDVTNRPVARGDFLSDNDVVTGRRVVVLGETVARGLFGDRDPIAQNVTLGGLRFRVVGIAESRGASVGVDQDAQVYIPITTAQRMLGLRTVDTIFVEAPSRDALAPLSARVEQVLGQTIDPEEFSILTQDEILGVAGDILDTLTLVLAAIAGISLLVGGIGVSNIMLVSVSERTREIGLRKALGARTRDITRQFLVEAVVLCGFGGLLGVGAGVGLASLAQAVTPLPASVTAWSVAAAFGVSLAVGIVFGVFPARRAGRLDPVVALRQE